MRFSYPSSAAGRGPRANFIAVLVVGAALAGLGACASPPETSPPSVESTPHPSHERLRSEVSGDIPVAPVAPRGPLQVRGQSAVEDGEVPDGVTVFNDRYPAVSKLDSPLLEALRRAAKDAESDGVRFHVNSGWRSRRYQEQLFEQAVTEYGSEAKAARWVALPGMSVHETGGAVDVGPASAEKWLAEHGSSYGLCQIYSNEPWHYELRPDAVDHGCPAMYADPAHDPRLQQ